jgi:hypothetical protein
METHEPDPDLDKAVAELESIAEPILEYLSPQKEKRAREVADALMSVINGVGWKIGSKMKKNNVIEFPAPSQTGEISEEATGDDDYREPRDTNSEKTGGVESGKTNPD